MELSVTTAANIVHIVYGEGLLTGTVRLEYAATPANLLYDINGGLTTCGVDYCLDLRDVYALSIYGRANKCTNHAIA